MPESLWRQRHTKIVATLGPASASPETLLGMVNAGLDVARLNFSHGNFEDHQAMMNRVRTAEKEAGRAIAVLQDLRGPKIRLGQVEGEVELPDGEEIVLSSRGDFVGTRERLPTSYAPLAKDAKPKNCILLADGRLELEVLKVEGEDVRCLIKTGGVITSNKGINLPDMEVSLPSVTEKDERDLEFGLKLGVDYVALSFVRTAADIRRVHQLMDAHGRRVPVIAKIEKPQAVDHLEEIIHEADGIMVARGDLGVELPPEQVPTIQRDAIRLCRQHGKRSIVATQMLMSMTNHSKPTHAEVSDVANAVFDGADAVMLSEETAMGIDPVGVIQTMAGIAEAAEEEPEPYRDIELSDGIDARSVLAIARAAVVLAEEEKVDAIVAFTQRGLGPRLMAVLRPECPIIGLAPTDEGVRRLCLSWGVRPLRVTAPETFEGFVEAVESATQDAGLLKKGSRVVLTSKVPFVEGQQTNMLKLHAL